MRKGRKGRSFAACFLGSFGLSALLLGAWPSVSLASFSAEQPEQETEQEELPWFQVSFENAEDIPSWSLWKEKELRCDVNGDGEKENWVLKEKQAVLSCGDEVLYETDPEWLISDIYAGDLTRDGQDELVMLVWKRGSFGPSKPFWTPEDETGYSQHVFIFGWREEAVHPTWMSSKLGFPVAEGELEERNLLRLTSPDGSATFWAWESWGLVLVGEEKAKEEALSFLCVGDNIAHIGILGEALRRGEGSFDFSPMYDPVREKISSYDLAAVNQETILVSNPAMISGFPVFGTPETMGEALQEAGFDIILGATNHANDKGIRGIRDCCRYWRENCPEITLLGLHESQKEAEKIRILEKKGIRLALFNYSYGLNGRNLPEGEEWRVDLLKNEEKLLRDLHTAEEEADLSLVFLHAGEEYAGEPSEKVRELGLRLVEAGADVILCSHPHVVQPMEWLSTETGEKGLIFYSLGNFASNQGSPETLLGAAASLKLTREGVKEAELLPLFCHYGDGTRVYFLEDYTPELAERHILNREESIFTVDSLWDLWRRETEEDR